jgi:hypothetical protein
MARVPAHRIIVSTNVASLLDPATLREPHPLLGGVREAV